MTESVPGRIVARVGRQPSLAVVILSALLLGLASVAFRNELPMAINHAPHDDSLFLKLADSLRQGAWLGPYDNLTLAKGPAYPVALALISSAQLPLTPTEQLIYLTAASVCALLTHRLTGSRWLALVLFAVLALNPVMWSPHLARTIRDGFYTSMSLLLVSVMAWLALVEMQRGRGIPTLFMAFAVVLVGAVAGVFWLTRQEGVWLVPSLLLIAAAAAWIHFSEQGALTARLDRAARTARLLAPRALLFGAGLALVLGGTAATNAAVYGLPIVNDFTDGSFPAAYGAMARIEHDVPERYVPVPRSARQAAYEVSASAAKLEPYLEGDLGARWTVVSCGGGPAVARDCDEMTGAFFVWALRDAVAEAGHWDSLPESQRFLRDMADEINSACDEGRIYCGAPRSGVTPPVGLDTLAEALGYLPAGLMAMTGARTTIEAPVSQADRDELMRVALLYGRIAPPADRSRTGALRVRGWVASMSGAPEMTLDDSRAQASEISELTLTPAPDVEEVLVANGLPAPVALRFELVTECGGCSLLIDDGEEARQVAVASLSEGRLLDAPPIILHVDAIELPHAGAVLDAAFGSSNPQILSTMDAIRSAYGLLVPILGIVAGGGTVAALVFKDLRRRHRPLLAVAVACALAAAARTGVFALIEVTSWRGAIGDAYLAPAAPLLLVFAVLGTYLAVAGLAELRGVWRGAIRGVPPTATGRPPEPLPGGR